jgi:methylase of polypeptide subunit release factors
VSPSSIGTRKSQRSFEPNGPILVLPEQVAEGVVNVSDKSNEWEFQGEALGWISAFIASHPIGLDCATQEFANSDGKRSDVTVWRNRAANLAVLSVELKTPKTKLSDVEFQKDAVRKAQTVGSPYVGLWNMQNLALYRTPAKPRQTLLPDDRILSDEPDPDIRTAAAWLNPQVKERLHQRANALIAELNDLLMHGTVRRMVVDATVFVSALTERIRLLRLQVEADVRTALTKSKTMRTQIFSWAEKQGLSNLVGDLYAALAGQVAYRVVGQTLFYLSFKRQQPSLPSLTLSDAQPLHIQLRAHWDAIRAYDYEALFEESPLEQIPLSNDTEARLIELISDLDGYDWAHVEGDVLGTIFEQLIPGDERIALGQYYTSNELADLIISLTVDSPDDRVLDPALGTGTFLLRTHNRLKRTAGIPHGEILNRLWGIDISAFATELAVINLCRQDLDSQSNFPRIAVRDFFDLKTTDKLTFPPAQNLTNQPIRIEVPIPIFDAVVGNPPYVRSQQLDDLDDAYKAKLANITTQAGIMAAPKFDAFAYFIVHARNFLKPGGRLGFVTSAAWLTSTYGNFLKSFILKHFQPVLLLFSMSEPFFPGVAVDTVVVILEARALSGSETRGPMRFVTLKRPLGELLPESKASDYWQKLDQFTSHLESVAPGDSDGYSIFELDAEEERQTLLEDPRHLRNWARPFRMSPIYKDVFT